MREMRESLGRDVAYYGMRVLRYYAAVRRHRSSSSSRVSRCSFEWMGGGGRASKRPAKYFRHISSPNLLPAISSTPNNLPPAT